MKGMVTIMYNNLWHSASILIDKILEYPMGGTISQITYNAQNFQDNEYVVAHYGVESRFIIIPDVQMIYDWLQKNLRTWNHPDRLWGWWYSNETGRFCLDVSIKVTARTNAIFKGFFNHQEAIYHPASGDDILVDDYLKKKVT